MPSQVHWEIDRHRVRIVLRGVLDDADNREIIDGVLNDPRFASCAEILSDHTGLDEPISTQNLKNLVAFLRLRSDRLRHTRWAIVTARDASYGMMRMLQVHLEGVLGAVGVFRDASKAEAWLASQQQSPGPDEA